MGIEIDNRKINNSNATYQNIEKVINEKEDAIKNQDFEKAAMLKSKECSLREDIDKLKAKMELKELTVQDIAEVIENWTKIPVTKITEAETEKLLNLEKNLHNKIIGQNDAVEAVSRAIRRNRAGLKSTKRPPSFIFVGPTGVGKTELCKALAENLLKP